MEPAAVINALIRELLATFVCALFIELIAVKTVFKIITWFVGIFTILLAIPLAAKKMAECRRSTQGEDKV